MDIPLQLIKTNKVSDLKKLVESVDNDVIVISNAVVSGFIHTYSQLKYISSDNKLQFS